MAEGCWVSIWTDEKGRIHVGIMVGGERIHRRMPEGATQGDAKRLEAQLRLAAGRKDVHIPGDPPLVRVMDLYLEHAKTLRSPKTATFHALRAGPWCLNKRASEADLVAFNIMKDMRGHYAPATINRTLGAIKAALTIAFKKRMIPEDYGKRFSRIPENNKRTNYLTIAQVKALTDCASEQVGAAIWIALLTGCRRGEILKIAPEDISGDVIRIKAGNTKTLKERQAPIVPALRPWLRFIPLQISAEGLKTGFRRAREKAGMDVNFHDLRHSCASILLANNVPLHVIRDVLGHSSIKTTERYAHLQIDKQREALNSLSDAVLKAV